MAGFDLPAATLAAWAAAGLTPATEAEVSAIAALTAHPLPADYAEFLTTHGFADWHDVPAARYASDLGGGSLGAMLDAADMARVIGDLPPGHLPVIDDWGGHDLILLRVAPPAGAVLHWTDTGETAPLADSFTAFLATLAEPAAPVRRTGTLETDPATGFTIAAETRAAWAAYGTGSTPEPADELAALEAALGRPLPEALHTFLTTYGYATWFGDAPASFDLPPGAGPATDDLSVIYSTAVLPRALPLAPGAPLPFAAGGMDRSDLLIGLGPEDEGHIYWRPDPDTAPVRVADDLRGFLAGLFTEERAE